MKVSEVMTVDVQTVRPDQTVREAASFMLRADAGAIPVTEGDRLIGMITDRDIAVRGVAEGMIPQEALVRDVMTADVRWCGEDDPVEQVLEEMGEQQVRRLAVLNDAREVVGIVALGDLATRQSGEHIDEALREISEPG